MKNSLIWKIKQNDKTSYLFGTMHVKDMRAFQHVEKVYPLIDNCERFAAEYSLQDLDEEELAKSARLPEGIFLSDLFSAKAYAKVDNALKEVTGLSLDFFKNNRPLIITSLFEKALLNEDNPLSLDETIYNYAKVNGKQITGVEKFSEQLKIMEALPIKAQAKSLVSLAKNFDQYKKELDKTSNLYVEQRIDKLLKGQKKSLGKMRKILLTDRNIRMSKRIKKLTSKKSTFVAIGAAHLPGKQGVIQLLQNKGIKVRPI